MNYFIKACFILLLPCFIINVSAQINNRDFTAVDAYVKSIGPLDNMSMGTINNVVSNKFIDNVDKARAIYYWITHNIKYDIKAARTNNIVKNTPTEVLLYRKAVGIGFASLFQDMCSSANIRCLVVDGFIKNNINQIGENSTEINHSWAVVQLGQSSETRHYVDPALGSGFADADMKIFTTYYTDAYFFTEKATFNLQHYPDNEAWKLGIDQKNKNDFFKMPIVKVAAMEWGLTKLYPHYGKIKANVNKAVKFSFNLTSNADILKVELGIGEKKKYKVSEIKYIQLAGVLSFTYTFEQENAYPVTVLINGKELVSYYVEVE